MSVFTDLIAKSHARWTTLVEMGLGKEQELWINETAGIWQIPLGEDWSNLPVLLGFDMPMGETALGKPIVPNIETIRQGLEFLTEQVSYANMISTNKSWYFDPAKETIYVHCDSYNDPDVYQMILGTTFYASDRAIDLDGHYWEPCIVGTPVIELTRDPLLYGVMAFDGGSVVLANHGGRLDSLKDYFLYGQPLEIRFGGDDLAYADYRLCFKGYILNADLGEEEIRIDGIDKRYELGIKLPVNRFSNATYPYIHEKNIGKPIPLPWGPCKNVPCVCTNENAAAPANYTFKVADVADHANGIAAISQVYVNGEAKNMSANNMTDATFSIASANYAPGRTVTADVVGFNTTNALSVIEDIIDTYTDIAYNATYFDITEWAAARNNAHNIGLLVEEEKTVADIIADIAKSEAANFLAKDSGLYTWKKFSKNGNASWAAELREIENPASSDQDYDNYLTSVHVKYNRDWSSNAGTIESKEDLAAGIYQKYGQYRSYELDTLLTTEADAEELAAWLMDYMKDSRQIIENTLPVKYIETEIGDIVDLNGDRPDKVWMGLIRCEVIGIKKQLGDEPKVVVTGREVPT